jgi:hypothetical protein
LGRQQLAESIIEVIRLGRPVQSRELDQDVIAIRPTDADPIAGAAGGKLVERTHSREVGVHAEIRRGKELCESHVREPHASR